MRWRRETLELVFGNSSKAQREQLENPDLQNFTHILKEFLKLYLSSYKTFISTGKVI